MIPPSRLGSLRRRLLAWYDAGRRDLPWRRPQGAADPYRVWIAEAMLQQTRVATAIPYYLRFVERFPTLASLASAREGEVLALWSGLGYYARARHLHAAARAALRLHGGLPRSLEALRALPGFGPYTAGAVASIAFGIPAPAVDGNVARVLSRVFLVTGDPSGAAARSRLASLAGELAGAGRPCARAAARAAVDRPGDLNQALMDLGATLCTKRRPACGRCPVARFCGARAAGSAGELPQARRRPVRRPLVLACAIVRRGDETLVGRRPPRGLFAGLFAPPAAEIGPGDDPRPALVRTLRREGIPCRVGHEIAACERALTHRALTLRAFGCVARDGFTPPPGFRFARPRELERIGVPAAVRALLEAVERAPDST